MRHSEKEPIIGLCNVSDYRGFMKFKVIFVGLFLVFIAGYSFGQTSADFEKKYGSGTYYEIRPTVLMSAEFDKNGQVCSVSFQPNRISKRENTTYFGVDTLDAEILKEIFDELVAPATREGKFESMGFIMSGSMAFSAVFWENVRFNAGYSVGRKNRRPLDGNQEGKEGIDLLFIGSPDVAHITWTKRKCVEN